MKLIYFVLNGIATPEDKAERERFRLKGYKVRFSNASIAKGFEDSCDAVYLACDAHHIEKWATSSGIEVIKPAEPKPEPKPAAKPAAKRGPKPKAKPEPTDEEKQLAEAMLGGDE